MNRILSCTLLYLAASISIGWATPPIFALQEHLPSVSIHKEAGSIPEAKAWELRPYLFSSSRGLPLPFRLYAPGDSATREPETLPLIVYLHGAGAFGADNQRNVKRELAGRLLDPVHGEMREKGILLIPQYREGYNWWTLPAHEDRAKKPGTAGAQTLDLIDEMCRCVPSLDPRRIYAIGTSQGAFAIPHLLTAYPNRFAAAILIAGGTTAPNAPWSRKNLVPVWAIYSTDDPIAMQHHGAVPQMINQINWLDSSKVRVTAFEDAGHGGTAKRAWELPDLTRWLWQHHNTREAKPDWGLMREKFE